MRERGSKETLLTDPDVARAMAMLSGAREEAKKIVSGNSSEDVLRRTQIELKILKDLTERNTVNNKDGKPSTNTKIPGESTPSI